MSHERLLLLSNSKNYGERFLDHAENEIKDFLGEKIREVLFIPYASVRASFDDFRSKVRKRFNMMGFELVSIHEVSNQIEAVRCSKCVVVGGGNTFYLLHKLYETSLFESIRSCVTNGTPYIGWSAGANIACPTIKTTNDMPIVEPRSLSAFSLIPFQINPHYTDSKEEGYQGESRSERIAEYNELNPDVYVVGLREGSILRVEDSNIELSGSAKVFLKGLQPTDYYAKDSLQFLLESAKIHYVPMKKSND